MSGWAPTLSPVSAATARPLGDIHDDALQRVTQPARLKPMLDTFLADVEGPWTGQVVETMIGLNAMPESRYDRVSRGLFTRPHSYESWVWDQQVNGYLLHVLGYEEPNTERWEFVVDLSTLVHSPGMPVRRGRLALPTLRTQQREVMHDKAAAMANYALSRRSPTALFGVVSRGDGR